MCTSQAAQSVHAALRGSLAGATLFLASCATPTPDPRVHTALESRTGHASTTKADPRTLLLPPGVSLDAPLTVEQAIAVALWNNAAFQAVLADLGLARAEVIRAGQLANPTFSLLFPAGPKQLEFAAKFPVEALWLRPRRLAIAGKETEAVARKLVEHGLDVVRDVRVACAELELVQQRLTAAREAAALRERMSRLADARLRAGDASPRESAQARADVGLAEGETARLAAEFMLAEQRFRALLGLATRATPLKLQPLPPPAECTQPVEELLREALAARPELRAAELMLDANGRRAGLAKAELFALSAVLDANGTGRDFEIGPGLEIPLPILHQNQAARALADAQVTKAARQYVVVRDRIAAGVREAHTRLNQAGAEHLVWERTLPALETAAQKAQKAFELGDISRLESLEAARKVVEARSRAAESLTLRRRALAELERAVGHRLNPKP